MGQADATEVAAGAFGKRGASDFTLPWRTRHVADGGSAARLQVELSENNDDGGGDARQNAMARRTMHRAAVGVVFVGGGRGSWCRTPR